MLAVSVSKRRQVLIEKPGAHCAPGRLVSEGNDLEVQ